MRSAVVASMPPHPFSSRHWRCKVTPAFLLVALAPCLVVAAGNPIAAAEPREASSIGAPSGSSANCAKQTQYSTSRKETLRTLGELLFFDQQFSRNGDVSCASCHVPSKYFSDARPVSRGTGGANGTRNAPSLLNVSNHRTIGWDGRRASVADQVLRPFTNPSEHGLGDVVSMAKVMQSDTKYKTVLASLAKGDTAVDLSSMACALTTYVESLKAEPTPFERSLAGEQDAIDGAAKLGLELFRGRAGCSSCHVIERNAFTDDEFHSLGVGIEAIQQQLPQLAMRVASASDNDIDVMVTRDADVAKLGRYLATRRPSDIGKFRTPSLRYVSKTAPYMHDGSIPDLDSVIDHELYYRNLKERSPIILTPAEKQLLKAFLQTL